MFAEHGATAQSKPHLMPSLVLAIIMYPHQNPAALSSHQLELTSATCARARARAATHLVPSSASNSKSAAQYGLSEARAIGLAKEWMGGA